MNIHVNTALCGFYKSTNIIKKINSSNDKYIYALPSIELCKSKRQEIEREFDLIHTDEEHDITAPVKNFIKAVEFSNAEGVVTTHATLKNALLNGVNLNTKYHLVIDELIDFHKSHYFKCTFETYQALRNYISFVNFSDNNDTEQYEIQICANKLEQVQSIIKNKKDEDALLTSSAVCSLLEYLMSASHKTFITLKVKAELDNMTSNSDVSMQFQALSTLSSDALDKFESVTILSSLFDWTISYHLLKNFGYEFTDITHTQQSTHKNKNAIITYYTDKNYTRTLRLQSDNKNTIQSYIAKAMLENIGGNEYIYNGNVSKNDDRNCTRDLLTTKRGHLVNTVHGHNGLKHITHAAWLSSQYATTSEKNVLTSFNVPSYIIDYERNQLNIYQFLMRTALRDIENNEQVHLHVADKKTAEFLRHLFPLSPEPVKHEITEVESIIKANEEKAKKEKEESKRYKKRSLKKENEALYRKILRTKNNIDLNKTITKSKAKELITTYNEYSFEADIYYNKCIEINR